MANGTAITVRGTNEASRRLLALPKEIVTQIFLEALANAIEPIEDELRTLTPEQEGNRAGGKFDEPGSLKESLDSRIELDSSGRGGRAGVGYGNQSDIAALVEYGHQMVTHDGKTVGSVRPDPFMRRAFDGSAPEAGIARFAETIEQKLPGLRLP